jgi:UDP-glucose 4-epimerase
MEINYQDTTVLITGGTGSFGVVLLKKLLQIGSKEIRVFSRDEKKQSDLKQEINHPKVKYFIGDVRDKQSMFEAFRGVDYVFHAAALKQVNTLESFPLEATKTNLFGAQNIIECSIENNVKKVIFLSTDKAVEPINAMGLSKALMEKLVLSKSSNSKKTQLIITRFGNVIASRGSIIPIIIQKLNTNQVIPITNPNMTRFLMSLTDAVNLVLYAFENGNDGDIFIKKAKAVRLIDLVYYFEKKLNTKAKVEVTNYYPGEKLHKSLISQDEVDFAIDEVNFFRIPKLRQRNKNIIKVSPSNTILMNDLELCEILDNNQEINQMLK